jgi:calcineurin-like phosphoesterase family protein
MAVFFTSDTHFGDPRVLRIDRRPFRTVVEHDQTLIGRWNVAVAPSDTVWHLGDVSRARTAAEVDSLLDRLNGQKHLIIGNNDPETTLSARGWSSIGHYAELTVEGRRLVLCHYPFRTWNDMGKGVVDLHGHSHGRLKPVPRQFDVGVDVWSFTPVLLATILASRPSRAGRTSRS